MADRKIVAAAHGHCFDGLASAAMFTHLRRERGGGPLKFKYLSCGYGPNLQTIPEKWLGGGGNRHADLCFPPKPEVTWGFRPHIPPVSPGRPARPARRNGAAYLFHPGLRPRAPGPT